MSKHTRIVLLADCLENFTGGAEKQILEFTVTREGGILNNPPLTFWGTTAILISDNIHMNTLSEMVTYAF